MTIADNLREETEALRVLIRRKLGVRAADYPQAVRRAGRQMPAPVRRAAQALARALPMAEHPRLRLTLDPRGLEAAAAELRRHLERIDLTDRRKGAILSVLGSIAFSLIAVATLLVAVLAWRGFL